MTWQPPRCGHGNIILGCPEVCDEQTVYLIEQETSLARWRERQQQEARLILELLARSAQSKEGAL